MKLPKIPKLPKLAARERLLAAGVGMILCALVLDKVILGPWLDHARRVKEEIQSLERTVRTYQQMLERRDRILAQAEVYGSTLEKAGAQQMDVAELLREIEGFGKESGISLGEVRPATTQAEEGGGPVEYLFDIQTSGTLKQWVHFVYLLQSSGSLFELERVTLSAGGKTPGLLEVSLRVVRRLLVTGV